MPKYCRAPHCSNAAGQARPPARRLSFYKFPLHDTARLRQWLTQMRRENWVPTRHQHLCSDHFEPSCFQYRWGVRYLRPDAVPTIFPRSPPKRESPSMLPGATQPKQLLPASSQEPVIPGQPAVPETAPSEATTIALEPDSAAATPLLGPVDSPEGVPAHPQPSLGYATAPPLPPPSPCRRVEQVEDVTIELPIASPPPAYFEPIPATPVTVPETVLSSALTLPIVSTVPIVSKTVMSMSPPGELSTEELVGVVLVLQRKVKVLQQRQRRHRARLEAMEGLVEQLRRESLLSEERLKLACLQPGPVTADPTSAVTIICQEEEEEEATLVYTVPPPAGTTCGLSLEQL
ncbi:THAP domain-containing protein 8 isoform X3 [Accipiter gentilis]|uniref:THAP domain-containing protein 8 isoform X3 n=1 Tax=Astur gentilis TaxID=8957 RepID=UPI002110C539|nr:THAP domain-containing protein 8 isoform X3 [Accipiter gentilis]